MVVAQPKKRRTRKKKQETPETPVAPEVQTGDAETKRIEKLIAGYKDRIKNPITAIRSHCVECMGGAPREVADCTSTACSLYPFRMGVNTMSAKYGKPRPDMRKEGEDA